MKQLFDRRGVWWAWLVLLAVGLACGVQAQSPAAAPGNVVAGDATPPTLVRVTSLAELYYGGACGAPVLTVAVAATDDQGPVARAWLEYAYAGAGHSAQIPLGPVGNDAFVGQIPVGQEAPQALGGGHGVLQYRVWAMDAAGNQTAAPGPSTWFEVQVRSCTDQTAAAVPGSGSMVPPFVSGGQPGGYPGSAPPVAPGGNPGAVPPSAPGSQPGGNPGAAPPAAPGGNPGSSPGAAPPSAPGDQPGDGDLPVICYPDCESDDGMVELPSEFQPVYPPGDVVLDPNALPPDYGSGGNPGGDSGADAGGNAGGDPGGDAGGDAGGGADPGANPGGGAPQYATLRVINQSSFPIVSLQFMYIDPDTGQSKQEDVILTVTQVIPSGGGWLEVSELIPGVTYSVMPGIGFWDASGRTVTGYLAPQTITAGPGDYLTMTVSDPSDSELITQFGTVTRYKGFVMGGSPLAGYCAYIDIQGNGYTFTLVHESGSTVLSDSGSWSVTHRSTDLGYLSLWFQGGQVSMEGSYYFKGPEIGRMKLLNVNVPGVGTLYYIELSGLDQMCP